MQEAKTIVITGGAGFVGVNLMQHALHMGYHVVITDTADRLHRLEHIRLQPDARLTFFPVHLAQEPFSFKGKVHTIIHLAALPQVDYSLNYPEQVVTNNFIALVKILHYALDARIPVLFTSSVEVYGGNDGELFQETDAYRPLSPYAASKVAGEALIHSYMHSLGLTASIVRLTNLYGPWQAPDRILPRLITQILSAYPCEVDWGRLRDFIYVEDAVKALLGIIEQNTWGETFNLASEQGYDNYQLLSMLQRAATEKINVSFIDAKRRDGRGKSLVSSSQKLRTTLQWEPSITLQEGIQLTFNWYASHTQWWKQFDENIKANRSDACFLTDYTHDL